MIPNKNGDITLPCVVQRFEGHTETHIYDAVGVLIGTCRNFNIASSLRDALNAPYWQLIDEVKNMQGIAATFSAAARAGLGTVSMVCTAQRDAAHYYARARELMGIE